MTRVFYFFKPTECKIKSANANYGQHTSDSIHDKDYENPERNEHPGTVNMEKISNANEFNR